MKDYDGFKDSVNIFDTQRFRQVRSENIKKIQDLAKSLNE